MSDGNNPQQNMAGGNQNNPNMQRVSEFTRISVLNSANLEALNQGAQAAASGAPGLAGYGQLQASGGLAGPSVGLGVGQRRFCFSA